MKGMRINTIEKGPNGRCLKDLMPKFKRRLLGGEGGKKEIKKLKKPYRRKTL
jgi:hypothetical protein